MSEDCRMVPTPIKCTKSESGLKIFKLRPLEDGDDSLYQVNSSSPLSFGSKSLVDDFQLFEERADSHLENPEERFYV